MPDVRHETNISTQNIPWPEVKKIFFFPLSGGDNVMVKRVISYRKKIIEEREMSLI